MELITRKQYATAVVLLVNLAKRDCSGSRAAAQVVLSAYNGLSWQLDVTDLCLLDGEYYGAALDVIRGRVELRIEPHYLVKNGNEIFEKLWEQWKRLRLDNRWKPTCGKCHGNGTVYANEDDENDYTTMICPHCDGEGLLAEI